MGYIWSMPANLPLYKLHQFHSRGSSSRAHFKDNLKLIKDWMGTIPLKLLISWYYYSMWSHRFPWSDGVIHLRPDLKNVVIQDFRTWDSHVPRLQWVIQGWLFSKLQYLEWSLIQDLIFYLFFFLITQDFFFKELVFLQLPAGF